jgi:hypothetical protein
MNAIVPIENRLHYRAKEHPHPVAAATFVDAAPARELLWTRLRNSEWREKSPPTEGLSLFVPDFAPERDVEVRFASDCSVYAQGYEKVMLFGPGDIANAHTETEYIDRRELELAALLIAELVMSIESRPSQGEP